MRDCTSRLRDEIEKQVQTQSWLNLRKSENESEPNAGAYELQSQIEECFFNNYKNCLEKLSSKLPFQLSVK